MDDLISRQVAIDAVKEWEKRYVWDDWCRMHQDEKEEYTITAPSDVISKLPSAKSDPDAEFWENRAAEYSKIIASLVADMSKGINFGSMQIAETGKIIFGKAESIIRCKDCKHQEKFFHTDGRRKSGGYYIYGCDFAEGYSHVCLDDDYCSRAERRTDE